MARRIGVLAALVIALVLVSATFGVQRAGDGVAAAPTTAGAMSSTTDAPATAAPTTMATTTTTTSPVLVPVGVPIEPAPEPAPPGAQLVDGFAGVGVVTVAAGGGDLVAAPGEAPFVRAREGLVFPAVDQEDDWIRILTTCDEDAWIAVDDVLAVPSGAPASAGDGFAFADAVIVVDAGHGGPNIGTSSPDGTLLEKDVNADIARRLRDLLARPNTVDWDQGTIYVGDEVPAAGAVIMTRVGEGETADYEAGLVYRATLANAAGAHLMISIHNNAGWEIALDHPGSDVYYQSQEPASRRFGELLVEEFQRSFSGFDADWVGAIEWGAKSRLSSRDGVSQYYGILRRADMPTVIAEGAYLANQSEADLLAGPAFRQAYAEAAYRAIVRFLTTDEVAGAPSYDPIVWAGFAGSGDPVSTCEVPAQP